MKQPGKKYRSTKKQIKAMKDKRWVQRANDDDKISTPDNKTHYMANEVNEHGDWMVFPTVRENSKGGLEESNPRDAMGKAYENRDALVYKNQRDAEKAAIYGYKKHTNFPKEVVKQAKKDWKEHKKSMKGKYRNGIQTAGKIGGALGGIADLVAINTTDDKVRDTAKTVGTALKAVSSPLVDYEKKKENMERTHKDMPTLDTSGVQNYEVMDPDLKTKHKYADDTVITPEQSVNDVLGKGELNKPTAPVPPSPFTTPDKRIGNPYPYGKTPATYADDTVINVPEARTNPKIAPLSYTPEAAATFGQNPFASTNEKPSTYRNGVNKREKKRYV